MIDAHHHLWDLTAREHRWLMGAQPWASDDELARLRRSFTLADLIPLAEAAGVTGTVVIQTVVEPWETPDLLALAAGQDPYATGDQPRGPVDEPADGGRLLAGVVGWTDLAAPAVADAVAGLQALPGGQFLCGIRHPLLVEADPAWLAQPAVLRGLRALAAAGLSFDLVTLPHQLPAAVIAARSVPELSFVLDHLGGPPAGSQEEATDGPWASAISSLAALPNVTCKLSGVHASPARASDLRPYYETVLAAFGPDRLMFGSDWPVSSLEASYGQVCDLYRELTAQLSPAERETIFERTARRVYRLPGPRSPGRDTPERARRDCSCLWTQPRRRDRLRRRSHPGKSLEFGGNAGGLGGPDPPEDLQRLPQVFLGLGGVPDDHGASTQAGQRVRLVPGAGDGAATSRDWWWHRCACASSPQPAEIRRRLVGHGHRPLSASCPAARPVAVPEDRP